MELSSVNITRTDGNIGRALPGQDHISGLLYYGTKPAGFGSENAVIVYTLKEAQDAGITAEVLPILHYHISEFFRINSNAKLYVGVYAPPVGAHDFAELVSLANFAAGEIRQVGVYTQATFGDALVTALQAVLNQLEADDKPMSAILSADISALNLSTLPDLLTAQAKNVSVLIAQDGGGRGSLLYSTLAKTISALGAVLGAVSAANVHESPAWVAKFNLGGAELDTLAFGEGTKFRSASKALLEGLHAKGYLFLHKILLPGSYLNGSWTCSNGDYSTIELNRTIDKAVRGLKVAYLPYSNAPVYVTPQGKMTEDAVETMKRPGQRVLNQMQRAGELSGYVVDINPDQDVTTGNLEITIKNVAVGVARNFNIKIGYAKSI